MGLMSPLDLRRKSDLLSPSSSLELPPDDVGDGRSDGDVTEDLTLCSTSTSRPLSFRQTLPIASWGKNRDSLSEGKVRANLDTVERSWRHQTGEYNISYIEEKRVIT